MKTKKIRGHKRKWKDIEKWISYTKNLDLDYLKQYQRDYAKIRVHPWSEISVTNSQIPEPKGETKSKIISGLIEIYDAWGKKLEQLGEPYYLKIWLFENRFSNSQVVCAIGDCLDFYENTFFKSDSSKELKPENYGRLEKAITEFKWDYRFDEDHFDNTEIGSPEDYMTLSDFEDNKKWFEKMLKKPHRTVKYKEPIGDATESYSFKKGVVWLGQK